MLSAVHSADGRRPQGPLVPAEVQVARAFVAMTGIDPTSMFGHQSPPVRERPRSYGPARPRPASRRPKTLRAVAARAVRRVRRGWHRAVRWATDLWARARRALTGP